MLGRLIRMVFRIGLLAGLGFALAKIVQSRRASSPFSGRSDWSAAPPRRTDAYGRPVSETPLVEPRMLHGVSLKKPEDTTPHDGQDLSASGQPPAAVSVTVTPPAPSAKTASPKRAAAKKAARKKAAAGTAAPGPGAGAGTTKKSATKTWVDPKGSFCPSSHPVKGKLSSGIFHLPGMAAYERTSPDRCYRDAEAAEAEGLRKAKR